MGRTRIEIPYSLDEEKIQSAVVPYVHKMFNDSLANMAYYQKDIDGETVYRTRYSGSGIVKAGHIKIEVRDDKAIIEVWVRRLLTIGFLQFRLFEKYMGEEQETAAGPAGGAFTLTEEKRMLNKYTKQMKKMLEDLSKPENFGK